MEKLRKTDCERAKRDALKSDEFNLLLMENMGPNVFPVRKRLRSRKNLSPWRCSVCGGNFRSIDGILESGKVVTCSKCRQRVCKIRCSRRETIRSGWICQICQKPESWFKGILKSVQNDNSRGVYMKKMNPNRIDEIDEDLEEMRRKEKEQVRDFIERVVSAMLGENIDDTSVNKLYKDKHYDGMFRKYHGDLSNALTDLGSALHISIANLPVSGSSPCSAHTSLKYLIQRIIREAIDLPRLNRADDHPAVPLEETDRTYEDLLATAVLNKVIQTYQDDLSNSAKNSVSSQRSNSSRARLRIPKDKEYFFSEETLDSKYKSGSVADLDTTSISSLESSTNSPQLSLTIRQQIEEISPVDEDTDDEDTKYAESKNDPNWQENWFLQKRHFNGTHSPVPVPMLVPNPTTEAKVLIGDREAEDTSDLSDAASDYGDTESVPAINTLLIESKTVIGGKNLLDSIILHDGDDEENSNGAIQTTAKKDTVEENIPEKSDENIAESLLSLDSNTEKDTEYTEKYASLPRTIMKSPVPSPRNSKATIEVPKDTVIPDVKTNGFAKDTNNHKEDQNGHQEIQSDDDELGVFQGSYSTREKEKWKHAVELKNNPYSKECLENRIKTKSITGSNGDLFGRDYYIKEAAKSTGARKKWEKPDGENAAFEYRSQISWPPVQEDTAEVFKAAPVLIMDETNTSVSEPTSPIMPHIVEKNSLLKPQPNFIELSSDSDLSIERVYNLQSGKIIEKIGDYTKEIKNHCDSPEGLKYELKSTDFDKSQELDENHNMTEKKRLFLRSLTMSDEETPSPIKSPVEDSTPEQKNINKSNFNHPSSDVNDVPLVSDNDKEIISVCGTELGKSKSGDDMMVINKYIDYVQLSEEKKGYFSDENLISSKKYGLENSMDGNEPNSRPASSLGTDSEIIDLKDKQLVKNILGEFSKSFPNLTNLPSKKNYERNPPNEVPTNLLDVKDEAAKGDREETTNESISNSNVQCLKKKFEKSQCDKNKIKNEDKQVYSLTARSIPRQFRQELKKQEDTKVNAEVTTEKAEEPPSQEADIKIEEVFPKAKSRIAYFENLKAA